MKATTGFITKTAMLIALTVVCQSSGMFLPAALGPMGKQFVVGSLVNACLYTAAATTGLWGGLTVAIVSPLTSVLTTHTPMAAFILPFSPFIAAGNFILVACFYFIMKRNKIVGVAVASAVKFVFLFAAVNVFLGIANLADNIKTNAAVMFSWPQLVTALIGGVLALAVIRSLGAVRRNSK